MGDQGKCNTLLFELKRIHITNNDIKCRLVKLTYNTNIIEIRLKQKKTSKTNNKLR